MDVDKPSKIGEALQFLLDRSELNPNSLSKATGIPRSSVYALLQKKTMQVDLLELKKLADYFGVGIDFFLDHKKYSAPVTLLPDEHSLLAGYRKLDAERKQRMLSWIDDLLLAQGAKKNR